MVGRIAFRQAFHHRYGLARIGQRFGGLFHQAESGRAAVVGGCQRLIQAAAIGIGFKQALKKVHRRAVFFDCASIVAEVVRRVAAAQHFADLQVSHRHIVAQSGVIRMCREQSLVNREPLAVLCQGGFPVAFAQGLFSVEHRHHAGVMGDALISRMPSVQVTDDGRIFGHVLIGLLSRTFHKPQVVG